ncbi:MAG TPA: hypothetical protein VNO43_16280 [Candidatus Eisenbacteria bacterium]|nr:hypothetical protein [Candidatus Eisenbacteria bacterium]
MDDKLREIQTGFHVCLEDSGKDLGAVRRVAPGGRDELIVYIQNEGNFIVPARAVRPGEGAKVLLDRSQLEPRVRDAIARAEQRADSTDSAG